MRLAAAALLALVTTLGPGCKKGSGTASCDAVGARFHAIAESDLAKEKDVGAAERDRVHQLLGPLRDSLEKSCRDNAWSAEARACMAAAADEGAFRGCESRLTGEQRALLEQSSAKGIQPK